MGKGLIRRVVRVIAAARPAARSAGPTVADWPLDSSRSCGVAGFLVQQRSSRAGRVLDLLRQGRARQTAARPEASAASWRCGLGGGCGIAAAAADEFHQQRDQADRALGVFDLIARARDCRSSRRAPVRRNCRPAGPSDEIRMARVVGQLDGRCSIATVASAKKVSGFSASEVMVPTLTPASRTSDPAVMPSTERKRPSADRCRPAPPRPLAAAA